MPHFFPLLESHGTKLVPVGVCTLESYIQYTPLGVYELSGIQARLGGSNVLSRDASYVQNCGR
jgi:hypothetical protein